MSRLSDLVTMSHAIGGNPVFVQGGGGNTSVKIDERAMWIKVSGVELKDVSEAKGFVQVDHARIAAGLADAQNEADYIGLLQGSVLAGEGRPSMEAGFHALLGRAVIHSHSLWLNVLACAEEGQGILAKILPQAVWVPYATPGLPVTRAIAKVREAKIIVLQNHGLIVSGGDTVQALMLHKLANDAAQKFFSTLLAFPLPREPQELDAGHLLFPDQAVYLTDAMRGTLAARQTLQAYDFLREMQAQNGLKPRFLPESEGKILLGLLAEKHRQKVAQS